MKILRWIILLFFVYIIGSMTLQYNGYCSATKSFITDEVVIKAAIDEVNRYSFVPLKRENCPLEQGSCTTVPYKDSDDFLAQNPSCCSVAYHASSPESFCDVGFWGRVFGHGKCAILSYDRKYMDGNTEKIVKRQAFLKINNCGIDITN